MTDTSLENPRDHRRATTQVVRRAASIARRRLSRLASLLANDSIVARRYVGTLGGASGSQPFELFFVGREEFAREFEVYFRASAESAIHPITVFRGNLARCAMHRRELAEQASKADFVAWEVFPGAVTDERDTLHYPMLDASLEVRRTVADQIRRGRSRAQRRLMRSVLASDKYRSWVDSSPDALTVFETTLHEPYVRRRFGAWASLDNDERTIRRLYARGGCILFVAERTNPNEPVCGTLLLDAGGGVLAYQFNGFTADGEASAHLMAERTAALELALVRHAIERGFQRIDLGYTRAILSDGLFIHKRRLGCSFAPVRGSPLFRVRARPTRRAEIFARYPLLAGTPDSWTAVLGYDDTGPARSKKAWHATLKNFRVPDLARAVVWTKARADGAEASRGERAFREAIAETLDLPDGVELRRDEWEPMK